jgi:hypothetical protein
MLIEKGKVNGPAFVGIIGLLNLQLQEKRSNEKKRRKKKTEKKDDLNVSMICNDMCRSEN